MCLGVVSGYETTQGQASGKERGAKREGSAKTHDELVLLFGDDFLVPPRRLPQPLHLGLEFPQLIPLDSSALVRLVQLFAEGEQALRVLRLEFVRVREFGSREGEFGLEAGDEGGADGGLDCCAARRGTRVSRQRTCGGAAPRSRCQY